VNQFSAQGKSGVAASVNFRQDFRLFPLSLDKHMFHYWYIFPVMFIVVVFLLDLMIDLRIIYLVNVFHQNWVTTSLTSKGTYSTSPYQNFGTIKVELTNWLLFSFVIMITLAVVFLMRWWSGIPAMFQKVLNKGLICSRSLNRSINQDYQRFLDEYQQSLLSRRRYLFIGFLISINLLFSLIQSWSSFSWLFNSSDSILSFLGWLTLIFRVILFNIVLGYILGAGFWTMIITGVYIRKLTQEFDLNVQPSHPDGCGGVKSLGNFCLRMASPIFIVTTLFGIYSIGSIFFPIIIDYERVVQIEAYFTIIVLVLPLAWVVFFDPIWKIHQTMVAKKNVYEEDAAVQIAKLESRIMKLEENIWSSFEKGKLEEAKNSKVELEILRSVYPDKTEYPTWPFDLRTQLTFLSTQIVAIIGLILPLFKLT
jgi:hypothetical protein